MKYFMNKLMDLEWTEFDSLDDIHFVRLNYLLYRVEEHLVLTVFTLRLQLLN